MQEHLAEITRNVMSEGAKWLPLSAKTPSDEGYPDVVDRLAFYRRYVYIMSIVPENSVRMPVEARKGLRIAVDQMKDRYMLTLGAVRELRANVKELDKQLNEERQKNITMTQQQARTASEPATRQEVPRVTYSAVTGQNIQRQRLPTPLASQDLRKRQAYNDNDKDETDIVEENTFKILEQDDVKSNITPEEFQNNIYDSGSKKGHRLQVSKKRKASSNSDERLKLLQQIVD
ncbi:hypothetical protein FQA39_LY17154 [Lamprigera yunnana]|nr:hypothetical protein FQA39_LY17154 [Lamprigera yunnana]